MRAKAEITIEDYKLIQVSDRNVFIKIGNKFLRFEITGHSFHDRSNSERFYYFKKTVFDLDGAEEVTLADFLQNIDIDAPSAVDEFFVKAQEKIEGTCPFCHLGTETGDEFLEIIKRGNVYQIGCFNCGGRGPISSTIKNALNQFNREGE